MKAWRVIAKLFMDTNRIETVVVRCNTARKARIFAAEKFKEMYPHINDMVTVLSVEEAEDDSEAQ